MVAFLPSLVSHADIELQLLFACEAYKLLQPLIAVMKVIMLWDCECTDRYEGGLRKFCNIVEPMGLLLGCY